MPGLKAGSYGVRITRNAEEALPDAPRYQAFGEFANGIEGLNDARRAVHFPDGRRRKRIPFDGRLCGRDFVKF